MSDKPRRWLIRGRQQLYHGAPIGFCSFRSCPPVGRALPIRFGGRRLDHPVVQLVQVEGLDIHWLPRSFGVSWVANVCPLLPVRVCELEDLL